MNDVYFLAFYKFLLYTYYEPIAPREHPEPVFLMEELEWSPVKTTVLDPRGKRRCWPQMSIGLLPDPYKEGSESRLK